MDTRKPPSSALVPSEKETPFLFVCLPPQVLRVESAEQSKGWQMHPGLIHLHPHRPPQLIYLHPHWCQELGETAWAARVRVIT